MDRLSEFIVGQGNAFRKKGLIVGLSGGIDSACIAAVAVHALGKEKVIGLVLPESESNPTVKNLAVERFSGQKATFWLMRGVFVRSWRLIGMTNYMMNVHTDPEFLHVLAKMMMEFSLAQLELLVEDGAAGGGLIICSSNSLHQGVNPENCIAMFNAVRKHGQYRKAANL